MLSKKYIQSTFGYMLPGSGNWREGLVLPVLRQEAPADPQELGRKLVKLLQPVYNGGYYMKLDSDKARQALELIGRGADVNITDEEGRTPLMYAVQQEGNEVVKALLDKGADIHAVERSGYGVEDFVRKESKIIRRLLREAERAAPQWERFGASGIALVETEDKRRLTYIFNFAMRERETVSENLETKQETSTAKSFDDLNPAVLAEALRQFREKGGEADDAFVFNGIEKIAKPARSTMPSH